MWFLAQGFLQLHQSSVIKIQEMHNMCYTHQAKQTCEEVQ
jgi:hypothetical protein